MNKYIEAIDSVNDELRFMDEENVSIEFKENIFNHIKDILSLDCDFADYQSYAVINMLYELAYQDIDIDRAIDFYSYNNYHIPFSDNFEMFSFDYLIKWLTTDNKKYEIQFYGELNPENNWSDTLEFKLYLDKNKLATYPIIVDYGDYMAPSEGGIDDMRVNQLVEDIAKSINNTVDIYEKLYQLSKKIMEEI